MIHPLHIARARSGLSRRLVACLVCVAALACALPGARALPFLTPDQPGEARTVDGQAYWMQSISLSTPRDYAKAPAGAPSFTFESKPVALPFSRIQQIALAPLTRRWIGSAPELMEYYPLGSVRNAVPPPPNWKHTYGQVPPWFRAQPTASVDNLPFLNHAVFCWTAPRGDDAADTDAGVYVFRQAMDIPNAARVVRATLHLASNAELLEAAFNDQPFHLTQPRPKFLAAYDVTDLVRSGRNIFAIRAREKPGTLEPAYGLAFSLELVEPSEKAAIPARPAGAALATTSAGDRVWGWVDQIQGDTLRMTTPYGPWLQELTGLDALIFPAGWRDRPADPGLFDRLLGDAPAPKPASDQLWGLPLSVEPDPLQDDLLLTEDRVASAKPSYTRGDALFCEGQEGKRFSVPRAQVLGIYPPRPVEWTFRRPQREDAILYCKLTTNAGETFGGLLREFNGSHVVLEADGGTILDFKPEHVSTLDFPYHAAPVGETTGQIGLIGQPAGQEAFRTTYLNDTRDVQGAGFSIGVKTANVDMATLADPAKLTPQNYPVLVSVDPVGEYLNTFKEPGDAQSALVKYLDRGGVMVVLSRGGAFRTALFARGDGFRRSADEVQTPSLLSQLNLATVRAGEKPPAGTDARGFNHPPNEAQEIFFARDSEVPQGLSGLPRHIPLDPMLTARFYPMVSTQQAATVLYRVTDETGAVYGPALSLIPKGRGTLVVIDYLLWNSRPDGQPFGDRLLPPILHWALQSAQPATPQ